MYKKDANKLGSVEPEMSQHSQDSNHLDVYPHNDDPDHEFLLTQIVRSSSPDGNNIELSLFKNSSVDLESYTPRRRKALRLRKDEELENSSSLQGLVTLLDSNTISPTTSIRSDREGYEVQLQNLQSLLEAALIENSQLKEELENERRERANSTFVIPPIKGAAMTAQTVEVKSGDTTWENILCEKSVEDKKEDKPVGKLAAVRNAYHFVREVTSAYMWNFLSDFHTEDKEEIQEAEEKEEKFAPSSLGDNIKRLTKEIKPYVNTGQNISKVLDWNKRFETLIVLFLYMISAYTGYTLQIMILLMLWRLSVNYIVATGLAARFGIFADELEPQEPDKEELNWVDKVSMARVILLKVQTIAGSIADGLEKINNLMTWRVPEVTMKMYRFLWVGLFASLILSTSFLLKLIGVMIGVKMFIIAPVYNKYPRVREKYDSMAKLWAMLPTNSEVSKMDHDQRQALRDTLPTNESESEESRNSPHAQAKERHILTKFGLTSKESIVAGWLQGKRANLMNRGNLLSGYKSGKLYLTNSYLCFEKTNATNSSDRIVVNLKDVQSVSKAKPFQILPGSGMSIEVFMKEEKSYLFAAIFSRDEVFKDIIETGLMKGYEWAISHEELK